MGTVAVLVVSAIIGVTLALTGHGRSAGHPKAFAVGASARRPEVPSPDVRWVELAGVALPVSSTDGPRELSDGLARGFSDTPLGAAIAAVHLVVRTSPSVATAVADPTMQLQVVGPNQPALVRSVSDARREAEATVASASIEGYVPIYFDPARAASVDLVIGSPDLALRRQYLSVRVSLQWSDDDWRLIAPPQGDWATVTSTVESLPPVMRQYGDA